MMIANSLSSAPRRAVLDRRSSGVTDQLTETVSVDRSAVMSAVCLTQLERSAGGIATGVLLSLCYVTRYSTPWFNYGPRGGGGDTAVLNVAGGTAVAAAWKNCAELRQECSGCCI